MEAKQQPENELASTTELFCANHSSRFLGLLNYAASDHAPFSFHGTFPWPIDFNPAQQA
jgi:hypothetical protein